MLRIFTHIWLDILFVLSVSVAGSTFASAADAAMIRGGRLTTSLVLAALLLPALISSLDDIDDDGIYYFTNYHLSCKIYAISLVNYYCALW